MFRETGMCSGLQQQRVSFERSTSSFEVDLFETGERRGERSVQQQNIRRSKILGDDHLIRMQLG